MLFRAAGSYKEYQKTTQNRTYREKRSPQNGGFPELRYRAGGYLGKRRVGGRFRLPVQHAFRFLASHWRRAVGLMALQADWLPFPRNHFIVKHIFFGFPCWF